VTQPPVVLTIAGSDSGGGSGLQADLRTFAVRDVHGVCAVTVVSSQNTQDFRSALPISADVVRSQIEAVLEDFEVSAVKTGLLFSEENALLVAELAESRLLPSLVVDPVLVDRHGNRIYSESADRVISDRLVPLARVVTPNHLEAMQLLERAIGDDTEALSEAALELVDKGPEVVVITGGRRDSPTMIDIVAFDGKAITLESERCETINVRGTGDTLSAAIAAGLARGVPVLDAVLAAQDFTAEAIRGAAGWKLGAGQGPIDHLGFLR